MDIVRRTASSVLAVVAFYGAVLFVPPLGHRLFAVAWEAITRFG